MEKKLYTLQETKEFIKQGRTLVIAGDDKLLSELPSGNWIAGSNPYLQSPSGGQLSDEVLYIADFTDIAINNKFELYDKSNIHNITTDAYDNGIIITLMPAGSDVLNEFAVKAPEFKNQFINPLLGWASGTLFEEFGQKAPTVYLNSEKYIDKAVALHLQLPDNKVAILEIINAYEADTKSPIVTFPEDGFDNSTCLIEGKHQNFYEYIEKNKIEYPQLIADYSGAQVNIGLIKNEAQKSIFFAAPVFKGTEYKFAKKKTDNYKDYFNHNLKGVNNIKYSYSCLYNLFNFGLSEENLGMSGVYTYGEIAYQLLNITFVYLIIHDKIE